jgi:3'(2'), 5'-bisphosphate nucleotidase
MLTNENFEKLVQLSIRAAFEAGEAIMKYYEAENLEVETKSDNSPVTQADRTASELIKKLLDTTGFPLLCEEEEFPSFGERDSWDYYWCVDPLDGTKEFIRKSKDFTVNIALMKHDYPVFGVVYLPVHRIMYFGGNGYGAYKCYIINNIDLLDILQNAHNLPEKSRGRIFTIVGSHSHLDQSTKEYIQNLIKQKGEGNAELLIRGSSVKTCLIAEGSADYYPRMSSIMEWDLAAGHAICEAAGCKVTDWNGKKLKYNKRDFYMPWFKIYNKSFKEP